MKWRSWSVFLVSFFYCGFLAAQTNDGNVDDRAKAAFVKGKRLYKKNQYVEASLQFRQALALKPTWKLHYNIGQCEAAAKRYGLALEMFESYLSQGGDDVSSKRQKQVRKEVNRLRDMVGMLRVRAPDGAVIVVNDVERGQAPLSGDLAVAYSVDHHVLVNHGDRTLLDRHVRVSGRQVLELEATDQEGPESAAHSENDDSSTEPESAVADESSQNAGPEGSPLKPIGWSLVGVGGATVIAGIVTGGMALSKEDELSSSCPDGICPPDVSPDLRDQRDSLGLVTNILLPVGGTLCATGLVMLIVNSAQKKERDPVATKILPIAQSDSIGFVLMRRF